MEYDILVMICQLYWKWKSKGKFLHIYFYFDNVIIFWSIEVPSTSGWYECGCKVGITQFMYHSALKGTKISRSQSHGRRVFIPSITRGNNIQCLLSNCHKGSVECPNLDWVPASTLHYRKSALSGRWLIKEFLKHLLSKSMQEILKTFCSKTEANGELLQPMNSICR